MAQKPATRPEFALFDVFYEDGSQRSNREFQVKSLVVGMLPRAPRSKNRIGLSLKGPANPPRPSRVSADPAENEPERIAHD
jgi:hypothetical protein